MIVTDWLGRIAFYLRSKDGIHWKVDPGEAYLPGIAKYEDGTMVDWFKYERIKVLQDEFGRATQAHFAVIDTIKWNDLSKDHHSSKHICIPLTAGRRINILDSGKINKSTKSIRLKISAEVGFDPHHDLDLNSLRFGSAEVINFGKGSKVKHTEKSGTDLIVIFEGLGNGLSERNFVAKLLGKTKTGELLFGYARLPWVDYLQPALSARLPQISKKKKRSIIEVEVQNFGQISSKSTTIKIEYMHKNQRIQFTSGTVPELKPFEKTQIKMKGKNRFDPGEKIDVKVSLLCAGGDPVELHGQVEVSILKKGKRI